MMTINSCQFGPSKRALSYDHFGTCNRLAKQGEKVILCIMLKRERARTVHLLGMSKLANSINLQAIEARHYRWTHLIDRRDDPQFWHTVDALLSATPYNDLINFRPAFSAGNWQFSECAMAVAVAH